MLTHKHPYTHTCLPAHTQECVLEKAITDGKAPGVIARLAKQAALFYHECAGLLGAAPLNQVCVRGGIGAEGRSTFLTPPGHLQQCRSAPATATHAPPPLTPHTPQHLPHTPAAAAL